MIKWQFCTNFQGCCQVFWSVPVLTFLWVWPVTWFSAHLFIIGLIGPTLFSSVPHRLVASILLSCWPNCTQSSAPVSPHLHYTVSIILVPSHCIVRYTQSLLSSHWLNANQKTQFYSNITLYSLATISFCFVFFYPQTWGLQLNQSNFTTISTILLPPIFRLSSTDAIPHQIPNHSINPTSTTRVPKQIIQNNNVFPLSPAKTTLMTSYILFPPTS